MNHLNVLVPYGDSLYYDSGRLTTLEAMAPPLADENKPELENLLQLVGNIISHTTSSMSQSKQREAAKPRMTTAPRTDSWSGHVGEAMQRWASDIGQQIAFQYEKTDDRETTWKILDTYPEVPLKTKAILSLVAFATMYGKVRLAALADDSNRLAKSITLLKQQPNIQVEEQFKQWFNQLSEVLNLTLDVADEVMNLKERKLWMSNDTRAPMPKPMLLSSAVYKIIDIVVICWSQVVNILIKHNRKDIPTNLWTLHVWEGTLNEKLHEIKDEMANLDPKQQALTVSNEQSQIHSLSGRQTSYSCWWKLCHLLNPTTAKSKKQMLLCTASHSLPVSHIISSSTQGDLTRNKEAE